jgi:hypothetical protein
MRLVTEDQSDPDAGLHAHISVWDGLEMEMWCVAPVAGQDELVISLPCMDFAKGQ